MNDEKVTRTMTATTANVFFPSIITAEHAPPSVPPLPADRGRSHRLEGAEPWSELAWRARRRLFRLRCPAESTAGLIGPYLGEGFCLEPLFPDGRALRWFDPTIPADDGDFVLVELSEALIAEIVEKNWHKPEFRETYGRNPPRIATKWLRHFQGQHYICEREKGIPLEGRGRILGTCTYIMIDGEPVYGSGAEHGGWADIGSALSPQIILNEASGQVQTIQIADEGVTTIAAIEKDTASLTNGAGGFLFLDIPFIGLDYTLVLIATFNVWITNFGGGTPEFFIQLANGGSPPTVVGQQAIPSATAAPGERIALQLEVAVDPSFEVGFLQASLRWTGAQPAGTAEVRNMALRAELVKR